jgi:hypothetical protein
MQHFENIVARLYKRTIAEKLIYARTLTKSKNSGVIAFLESPDRARMIEVIMGKDHLRYRNFTEAGRQPLYLVDNKVVSSGVDNGIYVINPVPVTEDQIRIATIGFVVS